MEAAKTAAHGYLTPEEATSEWKTWKSDPAVKSDHDGPRGFLRLARDWVTGIEGLEKGAEVQSKEAIGVLESFRALPEASRLSTEMSILGKRVSWLQAIQEGDQAVEKLIEEADKEQLKEDGESDKKAGTTSDDVEALAGHATATSIVQICGRD